MNFLHSSEIYGGGHAESIIGTAIKGRRDRFVIATKVRPLAENPDEAAATGRILEACEGSLRRLQTDYIDVYQLHTHPHPKTLDAVMGTMKRLRSEGKIRWVGISSTNAKGIKGLAETGILTAVMVGYNLMSRDGEATLRLAEAENLGAVVLSPLASGALIGRFFDGPPDLDPMDKRYEQFTSEKAVKAFKKLSELGFLSENGGPTVAQAALRFAIDGAGVTSVLVDAQRPGEIEENAGAAAVQPLAEDQRSQALAIADEAQSLWSG